MKQIFQDLRSYRLAAEEVPRAAADVNILSIHSTRSLISPGTERTLAEFSKANWLQKARQQPDKVRQVIQKIHTDGLSAALQSVRAKLDQPMSVGYSNVGVVLEVGKNITDIKAGDRVVSNGPHAEVVAVPRNLCAVIPAEVSDETAAFTVLGAIALHGIRLIQPELGERVVVSGLGLIGLLACQILKAAGCQVLGFDLNPDRVALAREFGAAAYNVSEINPVEVALNFSGGTGVDAVLITAATKSSEPIQQAPLMCRKRGRVVLTGVVDLKLNRTDFYKKEISFQVSCSYGPGRYEAAYENKGLDYPIGYVRWTEQRNFEAVLQLMKEGKLRTEKLISKVVPFSEAADRYHELLDDTSALGILFDYGTSADVTSKVIWNREAKQSEAAAVTVGLIGAGSFVRSVLGPALRDSGAALRGIASTSGVNSADIGKKFGFAYNTSDYQEILKDSTVNTVVIATRHNTHAKFAAEALRAGKHVFVEKPLALTREELSEVEEAYQQSKSLLMVGFNRRFSPHAVRMKELLLQRSAPLSMVMTVNAGAIGAESWVQDPEEGGGRVLGEACHFIDLLSFLAGAPVTKVYAAKLGGGAITDDKISITLQLADGSIGTIHYFANGHKKLPKERLEIFSEGRVLQLNNFRELEGHGFKKFSRLKLGRQDKGHRQELREFVECIKAGKASPISWDELKNVTVATIAAMESAAAGEAVVLVESAGSVVKLTA